MNEFFSNSQFQFLVDFLFHPQLFGIFLFVKIIFVIISSILVINIFFLIVSTNWINWRYKQNWAEFSSFKPLEAQQISARWKKVNQRLASKDQAEYKLAVLESEELLKDALKMDGYAGETLEEQLSKVDPSDISDTEKVIEAHNFRNEIVKNPEKELRLKDAKSIVFVFEKAFEEMQEY